jgi:preprotein translocase subunit SecA
VGKIQQESALVASLSNDGLRERTAELKREVRESIAEEEKEIAGLRAKAESEDDVNRKEELYNEVDKLEKQILKRSRRSLPGYSPPLLQ